MKRLEWFLIAAVVVFFVTGALFYAHMPAQVPAHFNLAGQVDSYRPRAQTAFIFPVIFLIIALIFFAIPRIDPKKENIAKFRGYYDATVMLASLFFYYIYWLILLRGVGYQFDPLTLMMPAFALLFYCIGIILPHTHPNWMVGIRTPWTISSPTVWKETHQLGGLLFKISGIIVLGGIVWPAQALWFLLGPILFSAVVLVFYSYILFAREQRRD